MVETILFFLRFLGNVKMPELVDGGGCCRFCSEFSASSFSDPPGNECDLFRLRCRSGIQLLTVLMADLNVARLCSFLEGLVSVLLLLILEAIDMYPDCETITPAESSD